MKPTEFINKFMPFANMVQNETGIPAIAILAQSALESGWGDKAIGNNLFGIKWTINDKLSQRVVTTEYSNNEHKFKDSEILGKKFNEAKGKWEFKVFQMFADYETPYDGFLAHANLLLKERYIHALKYKDDPKQYLKAIADSGYATDPNYSKKMADMVDSILKRV